jgi:hypothetical protein
MKICALAGIFSRSAGLKMRSCTPLIIPQISAMPIPKSTVIAIPEHTKVDPVVASELLNALLVLADFEFLSICG